MARKKTKTVEVWRGPHGFWEGNPDPKMKQDLRGMGYQKVGSREKELPETRKAPSKASGGSAPAWTPPPTATAAELCRKGLLAGIPDHQIIAAIRHRYPEYRAWKIAVPTYRRELQRKGKL